jgi:hypothetical protein
MAKKTKKDVRALVDEYRQLNAEGDSYLDGEAVLAKIVRSKDPAAVELLLTLYPTQEEWDYDEMGEVISALMDIPPEVFVPEFARLAAQVCRDTPELFNKLSMRVIARHLPLFLKSLPVLSSTDCEHMIVQLDERHREAWKDETEIPPEVLERHERVLAHLRSMLQN